jgi:pyruvate dehydrogenase E1 component
MEASSTLPELGPDERRRCLEALARKVLWLSTWTIHHANHVRPSRDGLKVGGHQASSASLVTIMTALYLDVLRPQDRVAVKPHASPVFHALNYLMGRQTQDKLAAFRALGGAQSYPSRSKDGTEVDFSTGSVGLGAAITIFAALAQDYVARHNLMPGPQGRMIALVGDAELDEGNIYEALMEGWKHDVRNVWWVIDYNRQSLDAIVQDRLATRIDALFGLMGWRVVTLKYGRKLEAAFAGPDGIHLREWIDACPNAEYSAHVYSNDWRAALTRDLNAYPGIRHILDTHTDPQLAELMTNLAGHDMDTVLDAFHAIEDDTPTCFIAYTIKGHGLPFAGHKDNHAGLMNLDQLSTFRAAMRVPPGQEWDRYAGLEEPAERLDAVLATAPFNQDRNRRRTAAAIPVPAIAAPSAPSLSTQDGFGRILNDLAAGDSQLAAQLVTTSPDVTVSTNLGPWVNRRGLFDARERPDAFREQKVVSAQRWGAGPGGQHIELGIAEHNLFLALAAFGLATPLFGARLLPIGTLYDPFIARGLDALNYACYQDARFMLVATPAGLTLAPEGGAHQSIGTPLIGLTQPGLTSFEPAHVDELAAIMSWGFGHMQDADGGSLYLRLSTRVIPQPARQMTAELRRQIVAGGYWLIPPAPDTELAVCCCGPVTPEARAAVETLREEVPGAGLLVVTSPDRLHQGWLAGPNSWADALLGALPASAGLITVLDGHPATLSWLGAVRGHRIAALGVDRFGQSGDIPDLYRTYRLDTDAILDEAARLLVNRRA